MMFPTNQGNKIMAIKYTKPEIMAMAEQALSYRSMSICDAIERVAGKYSEDTRELHSEIYSFVEEIISNDFDPLSTADRI